MDVDANGRNCRLLMMFIHHLSFITSNSELNIYQGFIDVFFFLFLDERQNRVRVTNCQSPLSPTKFFVMRRQRQLSDRPPAKPWRSKCSIFRARDCHVLSRRPRLRPITCRPIRPRNCRRFRVFCALLSS